MTLQRRELLIALPIAVDSPPGYFADYVQVPVGVRRNSITWKLASIDLEETGA